MKNSNTDILDKIAKCQKDVIGTVRIITSVLNQGLYFLQITDANHQSIHSQKIVK